jgi:D-serine deaminase-like pyridoxal phosphate-dependent protein
MTAAGLHSVGPERGLASRLLASPDLTTPALVLDRVRLDSNVAAMAKRASDLGATLWPHAKTHQSPEVAGLQLRAGAEGITVATIAEAETMVAAGMREVLVAYPPVDRWRIERIVALAARAQITVTLDDLGTVGALEAACARADVRVRYLWEVECGLGRCGTPPGDATAELVAAAVEGTSAACFDGLMTFAGHAYASRDDAELAQIARDEVAAVAQTAVLLERRGIACRVLSVGSTPTVHPRQPTSPPYRSGRATMCSTTRRRWPLGSATSIAVH